MTGDLDIRTRTRCWLRGDSPPEEARRAIHRLVAKMSAEGLPEAPGPALLSRVFGPVQPEQYAEVVSHAVEAVKRFQEQVEDETRRARPLLARFLDPDVPLPSPDEEVPGMRTWAFVHGLLIDYWEVDHPDPLQAVEMVRIAVRLALELDEREHGAPRLEDLRARAYTKLGNTLRIQSQFRRAEAAFARARDHLTRGTRDPLIEARLHFAEASLHGVQERFETTFDLLSKVSATARRFRDDHLLGKTLISRAHFKSNAGDTEEALRLLHRGLRFIDPCQEPRLVLVAWHNFILTLTDQDRHREAARRLPYVRSLHERFGNRLDHLRLEWVEGRIGVARGEEDRAEATLERVRRQFIEAGVGFDAALVSLDLAHVYARQGRCDDMRRLAEEMIPIFESRDMHREAVAALLVFQRAIEVDRVNLRLVEDLTAFLRRSRGNPKLRFRSHA